MNVQTIATLAGVIALALILHARTLARRRRRLVGLWLLLGLLVLGWAGLRQAWLDLGLALGAAAAVFGLWWLAFGRRLAPPDDSNIRVWTKEDPF